MQFGGVFSGKKILITGHTGFKGSWLSLWLSELGAEVIGVSNSIPTEPSNYVVSGLGEYIADNKIDVRDLDQVCGVIEQHDPDIIFHLAAQPLVRSAYVDPLNTMSTNVIGSINILEALRRVNSKTVCILITSDKVYKNFEWCWGYRETDILGGDDIYGASKGMAELAIKSYFQSYFTQPTSSVRIATVRAGNVIGGGDWAPDRIVPDCVKSWTNRIPVDVRYPKATRPWQHVLEPLSGYMLLASELLSSGILHGESFNFGPMMKFEYTVIELIELMSKRWGKSAGINVQGEYETAREASLLRLNCDKAMSLLNWAPVLNVETTVHMTIDWYREYYNDTSASMAEFSKKQLFSYVDIAREKKIGWAL